MNVSHILSEIDSEISRLQQVRALLARDGFSGAIANRPRKRRLSSEARARIAAAQKARWAKQKKAAKKAA